MWKIRFNNDPTVPYQNLPDNWFSADPASGIVYDPTHYDLNPETLVITRKDTNRPIDETLFIVNNVVVNNQDWSELNTWSNKTGEDRGLILQSLNASIQPYPTPVTRWHLSSVSYQHEVLAC
jgi:hypothetical protein